MCFHYQEGPFPSWSIGDRELNSEFARSIRFKIRGMKFCIHSALTGMQSPVRVLDLATGPVCGKYSTENVWKMPLNATNVNLQSMREFKSLNNLASFSTFCKLSCKCIEKLTRIFRVSLYSYMLTCKIAFKMIASFFKFLITLEVF